MERQILIRATKVFESLKLQAMMVCTSGLMEFKLHEMCTRILKVLVRRHIQLGKHVDIYLYLFYFFEQIPSAKKMHNSNPQSNTHVVFLLLVFVYLVIYCFDPSTFCYRHRLTRCHPTSYITSMPQAE